jgi:hypothetical protein
MVFLLPAWANRPKEYKKGGKVKKDKKPKKAPAMSQNVKVNVKVGDSVLLHKGKAPRRSNPGVAKRFLSPGSAFGGGLPGPLSSLSYASAPPVAMPLGRMDFINSGDGVLNRGRDRRDDIPINVNPYGIRADVNPSIRYQPSSNPNVIQHASAPIESSLPFQGRQPRLNMADTSPSMNAVPPPIRIPRESPISSIFSSSEDATGLSNEEADIMYGTESGLRLSAGEASARQRGTVFESASASASASAKPLTRGPRIAPKKPIRGDMSPPALRRGGTVF